MTGSRRLTAKQLAARSWRGGNRYNLLTHGILARAAIPDDQG